jgi:hypothetical protein
MLTIQIIRNRDNTPKSDARVSIYFGMLGQKSRDGRTNAQGKVSFDVPPGEYRVTINAPDYAENHTLRDQTIIYANI